MIDIGVNFYSAAIRGTQAVLLNRASRAGVQHIIATGTHLDCSRYAQVVASQYAMLSFTAGIHPCSAHASRHHGPQHFASLWDDPKMVAIGECGLDYFRHPEHRLIQRQVFAWQLDAALAHKKPVFLHERDAFDDMYAMLRDFTLSGGRGIVHCFTGNAMQAQKYLDLGLDIGVTGWLSDEQRNADLVQAMRFIPLNRLHIETDAPYLRPRNAPKSKHNCPSNLVYVASSVASFYPRMDRNDLIDQLARNSIRFFDLPTPIAQYSLGST